MKKKRKATGKSKAKRAGRGNRKAPRKAKRKTVKVASARESVKKHGLLENALREIERGLGFLRGQKLDTEKELGGLASSISYTQNKELELKNTVQKLVAKEEQLNLKRERLQEQIQKVKEKITKISQLEAEMEEIS